MIRTLYLKRLVNPWSCSDEYAHFIDKTEAERLGDLLKLYMQGKIWSSLIPGPLFFNRILKGSKEERHPGLAQWSLGGETSATWKGCLLPPLEITESFMLQEANILYYVWNNTDRVDNESLLSEEE